MNEVFAQARVSDYATWLRGYAEHGGRITHVYDYPMSNWSFLVALRDFRTGGECGAASVSIIVPEGINHICGGLGHNDLFFMDGFRTPSHIVPAFNDTEFKGIPGMKEARRAEKRRQKQWAAQQAEYEAQCRVMAAGSDIPSRWSTP